MENNHINDLIDQGKKQLAELQKEIEKLADTAGKAANVTADEVTKRTNEIVKEAEVHLQTAKTLVEEKTKEAMGSEEFKKFEEDGKKAAAEAQVKLAELADQASTIANDFGNKLRDIFAKK